VQKIYSRATNTCTSTGRPATTTTVASSNNPSQLGQSVALTATLTPGATGTVTFRDGAAVLGAVPLVGGTATFSAIALAAGTHAIAAIYGGDLTHLPSTGTLAGGQVVNAISLVSAASRKNHGAAGPFDIAIDLTQAIAGAVTVEPRALGLGHKVVFLFSNAITATGAPASTVGGTVAGFSGNEVIVTVTGVADASRATVSLSNVNGANVNASASLGFLVGDVNKSGGVTATDIQQVKSHAGQSTIATNALNDVGARGAITASAILATKGRLGFTIP